MRSKIKEIIIGVNTDLHGEVLSLKLFSSNCEDKAEKWFKKCCRKMGSSEEMLEAVMDDCLYYHSPKGIVSLNFEKIQL